MFENLPPLKKLGDYLGGGFGPSPKLPDVGEFVSDAAKQGASLLFGASWDRIAALVIGLILIAGALYTFPTTRAVVAGAAKTAATVAA